MINGDNNKGEFNVPVKSPRVGTAFLLSQAGAHAAMAFGERLRPVMLTPQDAGILRILGSNPGLTQQALSQMLGMFPSRLVALLDGLEKKRLIERRASAADRRVYQLRLTVAGFDALTKIGQLTTELESDIFAALSQDEKRVLGSLLARIIAQQQITPSVHPAYRHIGIEEITTGNGETFMQQTFVTKIQRDPKKNVTGIIVPAEVVSALSSSKNPAVRVTLNGYTYRSMVAVMGGKFMVSLSTENRKAAGLAGDEELEVRLELDTDPRIPKIPADLKAALVKNKVLITFEGTSPSRRKEFVRQIEEAKTAETRERRIEKVVSSLRA